MTEAATTVNAINKELARALREQLRRLPELETAEGLGRGVLGMPDSPALSISTLSGEMSAFEYKVREAHVELADFWSQHAEDYLKAVRQLPGLLVTAGNATEAIRLATYFDTVIVDEMSALRMPGVLQGQLLSSGASNLYNWNKLLPTLECDADTPIVVAWPEPLPPAGEIPALRYELSSGQFSNPLTARAAPVWFAVLERLGAAKPVQETVAGWYSLPERTEVDVSAILDIATLRAVFPADALPMLARPGDPTLSELSSFFAARTSRLSGASLRHILGFLFGSLYHFAWDEDLYVRLRAHPTVRAAALHRWNLEIQAEWTRAALGLSPDYAAAQTIRLPSFSWVDLLDATSLVRFRESGALEVMRSVFREEHGRLARSSPDGFSAVAGKVQDRLVEAVNEHERELLLDRALFLKRFTGIAVEFGLSVVLGLESIALPSPVSYLAAVAAAGFGTAALDVIEAVKQHKQHRSELRHRPVAVLADFVGGQR